MTGPRPTPNLNPNPTHEHAQPAAECAWCPLCRFAALFQGEHTEATAKVIAAASVLIEALRGLLDNEPEGGISAAAPSDESASTPSPSPSPSPAATAKAPRSRVQRIDLTSDPAEG